EPTIPGFLARIDKKNWNALEYKGISNRLEMPWPAFYNEYFQTKMKTLPDSAVVDNYLRKQKDLTSEVNWDVLSLFNVSDDLFTNLIRAKDSFKAKYGMEASFKIVNMYKRIAQHYMATQDSVNYNRITLLLTQPKDNRDSAAWNAFYVRQLQFLGITGMDWDKFISITKMVRQRYGTKNDEFIVQYAYASKLNDQTAEYLMGMLDTLLISRPLAGNYLMYSILWLQRHDQEKARYYLDKAVTASATKEAKDRCRMEFERLQNKMSI
ncbi:MAG TPA: hypothetical protein VI233_04740, partial [Puia sp.]